LTHFLKKELADRHVLISSQSEKISQLDAVKNGINSIKFDGIEEKNGSSSMRKEIDKNKEENNSLEEMDRLHREMDRMLKRIQQLEREKEELLAKKEAIGTNNRFWIFIQLIHSINFSLNFTEYSGAEMTSDERVNSLRQR
jgi:hypothetical protein